MSPPAAAAFDLSYRLSEHVTATPDDYGCQDQICSLYRNLIADRSKHTIAVTIAITAGDVELMSDVELMTYAITSAS